MLLRVGELADHRELVGPVQLLDLLVESAGGPEVRELEGTTRVPEPVPEDLEGPVGCDLAAEEGNELVACVVPMKLLELVPGPGLGGVDEVEHHAGVEAESLVVIGGRSLPVASGCEPIGIRPRLGHCGHTRIRPAREEGALDGQFKGAFGDLGTHGSSVPSFRISR